MYNYQDELAALRRGEMVPESSGDYWSREAIEEMKQEFADGIGISVIALRLNRTERAVIQQLSKLGLLDAQSKHRERMSRVPKKMRCLCIECGLRGCQNCGREFFYAREI